MSVEIPVLRVRTNGATQARATLDNAVVREYAEALQGGAVFPPIVVFYDGEDHWLADGFHRLKAHARIGATTISATVKSGTVRDARLYAVGANVDHGLRRTNADKRRAVETLLRDEEWSGWTDVAIAEKAGVHPDTVGRIRAEDFSDSEKSPEKPTAKDGSKRGRPRKKRAPKKAPPSAPAQPVTTSLPSASTTETVETAADPAPAETPQQPATVAPAPERPAPEVTAERLIDQLGEDYARAVFLAGLTLMNEVY